MNGVNHRVVWARVTWGASGEDSLMLVGNEFSQAENRDTYTWPTIFAR